MQRELVKWLQTLELSRPIKIPQHDLANGYLIAEIISRYNGTLHNTNIPYNNCNRAKPKACTSQKQYQSLQAELEQEEHQERDDNNDNINNNNSSKEDNKKQKPELQESECKEKKGNKRCELNMNAISNGMSSNVRRDNWQQIQSALLDLGCTCVTVSMIEAVLRQRPAAAENLLIKLYEFFTHRSLPAYSYWTDNNSAFDHSSKTNTNAVNRKSEYAGTADSTNKTSSAYSDEIEQVIIISPVAANTLQFPEIQQQQQQQQEEEELEYEEIKQQRKREMDVTNEDYKIEKVHALPICNEHEEHKRESKKLSKPTRLLVSLPEYACPTATTLIRHATHPLRVISLGKDKYDVDVAEEQKRNKQLIAQHNRVQRRLRREVLALDGTACNKYSSGNDNKNYCTDTKNEETTTITTIAAAAASTTPSLMEHFRNHFTTQNQNSSNKGKNKQQLCSNSKCKENGRCKESLQHARKKEPCVRKGKEKRNLSQLTNEEEDDDYEDDDNVNDKDVVVEKLVREILMSDEDDDDNSHNNKKCLNKKNVKITRRR